MRTLLVAPEVPRGVVCRRGGGARQNPLMDSFYSVVPVVKDAPALS